MLRDREHAWPLAAWLEVSEQHAIKVNVSALNAEATRQAAMLAYIDDFELMMIIIVVALPLLLLLRTRRLMPGATAALD